jgi:glycosyltransferase involved in cell wall biosynthesis
VHQFLPRHLGGTEIYCSDLSFALARRGHAVRVLSAAPFPGDVGTSVQSEDGAAIGVEKVAATRQHRWLEAVGSFFDRFDNPEARQAIRRVLHRMRPDVVHVQHLLYLSAELFAECRRLGIPVVVMLNDYWFLCHRIKLRRRDGSLCEGPARGWNCCQCLNEPAPVRSHLNPLAVGANMYRYAYLTRQLMKADRILAPSRYLRDVYSRNGVPAERITYCDYGTVTPPPEVAARFAVRRPRARIRFGFLGALTDDKGVHVLADAFNQLPVGVAELHLFGFPGEPGYMEDLQQRARHPDIHWRGSVAHVDRWQALAEIDVLVVPSIWYENSPLTIHEAHMARVPVIASAVGGILELVRDGVTGRTFPVGHANALAAVLREVVAQPECLSEWRRAIVPPKTMAAHAEEIEAIYRGLRVAGTESSS